MEIDEETFVDLIEKCSHLWDKRNPLYKDNIAMENSWQGISSIMGISGK